MSDLSKATACTCLDVFGEDPDCARHGIGTAWWADILAVDPNERATAGQKIKAYDDLVAVTEGFLALKTAEDWTCATELRQRAQIVLSKVSA